MSLPALKPLLKAITLIEIDAAAKPTTGTSTYGKRIGLKAAVSGTTGRRTFYKRKFAPSSSFLKINPELAAAYGMQNLFEPDGEMELECETLRSILAAHELGRVDFLKTDLEGLDFEVLTSAPDLVGQSLVIQSELRFQPLYVGEPDFCATASFLRDLGFELITLRPEFWKYATRHSPVMRDGRLAWADAIFVLSREKVEQVFQESAPRAFVKQIILAQALEMSNYAEHLYESAKPVLPAFAQQELQRYLAPGPHLPCILRHMANSLAEIPGGGRVLWFARRLLLSGARACTIHKNLKHLAFPS